MYEPELKLCPFCAEEINAIAVKCSQCNSYLDEEGVRDAEKIRSEVFNKSNNNEQKIQIQENVKENNVLEEKEHNENQTLKEVETSFLSEEDESPSLDRFHTEKDELLEKTISVTSDNNVSKQSDAGLYNANNVKKDNNIEQTDQESSLIEDDKMKDINAEKETIKSWCSIIAWCSYIVSAVFIGIGFYKLFAYNNPESGRGELVNAYVGGDAYNYIINANYATAYFALAILFAIIGMTGVIGYIIITQSANQAVRS